MDLQLIRNATIKVKYSRRRFITDPFLMPKHTIKSFAGISPNPLVDLPFAMEEVLEGIEAVVVSHLHPDHFDPIAQQLLPKNIQIFCQPTDENILKQIHFQSVIGIENSITWEGIKITRTPGQHGTGILAKQMGNVSGFVFEAENEPTVYWAGDTILYQEVFKVLEQIKPDIIITHSGGARFPGSDPIIMDGDQTIAVSQNAPESTVIAIHMEALDHCTVSRSHLREMAEKAGIQMTKLLIPADGESISL